jgi:hypothetical protein
MYAQEVPENSKDSVIVELRSVRVGYDVSMEGGFLPKNRPLDTGMNANEKGAAQC